MCGNVLVYNLLVDIKLQFQFGHLLCKHAIMISSPASSRHISHGFLYIEWITIQGCERVRMNVLDFPSRKVADRDDLSSRLMLMNFSLFITDESNSSLTQGYKFLSQSSCDYQWHGILLLHFSALFSTVRAVLWLNFAHCESDQSFSFKETSCLTCDKD